MKKSDVHVALLRRKSRGSGKISPVIMVACHIVHTIWCLGIDVHVVGSGPWSVRRLRGRDHWWWLAVQVFEYVGWEKTQREKKINFFCNAFGEEEH